MNDRSSKHKPKLDSSVSAGIRPGRAPWLLIGGLIALLSVLAALSPAMPFDLESGRNLLQAERLQESRGRDRTPARAEAASDRSLDLSGAFSPYSPPLVVRIDGRAYAGAPPTWAALLALVRTVGGSWGLAFLPVAAALLCLLAVRGLARQVEASEKLTILLAAGSPLVFYALEPSPALPAAALVAVGAWALMGLEPSDRAAFSGSSLSTSSRPGSPRPGSTRPGGLLSGRLLSGRLSARELFAGVMLGLAGWLEPACLPAGLAAAGALAADAGSRRRIPALLAGWAVSLVAGLGFAGLMHAALKDAWLMDARLALSDTTLWRWDPDSTPLAMLHTGLSRLGAGASSPMVSLFLALPALALLARGAWGARPPSSKPARSPSSSAPHIDLTPDAQLRRSLFRPRGLTVNALATWLLASLGVLGSLLLETDPIEALAHIHGLLPLTPWLALTLFGLERTTHPPTQDGPPPSEAWPDESPEPASDREEKARNGARARAIRRLFLFAGLLLIALLLWPDPASSLSRWSQPRLLPIIPLLAPLAVLGIRRLWARGGEGRRAARAGEVWSTAEMERLRRERELNGADDRPPSPLIRPLLAGIVALSLAVQGYGLVLEHRGEQASQQVVTAVRTLESGAPLVTPLAWYVWQAAPAFTHRAVYRVTDREELEQWLTLAWMSGVRRWVWASDLPDELFLAGLPLKIIRRQEVETPGHPALGHHLVALELLEPEGQVARETWAKLAARTARRLLAAGRRDEAVRLLGRGLGLAQEGPLREAMERMAGETSMAIPAPAPARSDPARSDPARSDPARSDPARSDSPAQSHSEDAHSGGDHIDP